MVDALRRAHRMVAPDGFVVEVHPDATLASVHVGGRYVGPLDAAAAMARHAAAGRALAAALAEGLFNVVSSVEFDFATSADTIEELRDYVGANWRDSRIPEGTVAAARLAAAADDRARPTVIEHVLLTLLRPIGRRAE